MKRIVWCLSCFLLAAAIAPVTLAMEDEVRANLEQRKKQIRQYEIKLEECREKQRHLDKEGTNREEIEKLGNLIEKLEREIDRRREEIADIAGESEREKRPEEWDKRRDKPDKPPREVEIDRREGRDAEAARDEKLERLEREMRARRELEENELRRLKESKRDAEQGFERNDPDKGSVFAFLKEHYPYFARELQEMREQAPDEFRDNLEAVRDQMMEYRELQQSDPDAAELFLHEHRLEDRSHGLAEELVQTDNPERREQLRRELAEVLNKAFDVKMREGEVRIHHLKAEIEEIARVLEQKRQVRERIIERRMRQLAREHGEQEGDEDILEWW